MLEQLTAFANEVMPKFAGRAVPAGT
jgi:hypothetical protein